MRHAARMLASIAALSVAGCGGTTDPSGATTPPFSEGQAVTVTPLGSNGLPLTSYSGLATAQRTVIRDAPAWRAAWASIWARTTPIPAVPTVNFTRQMVVVAALGQRNSGGYTIHIDSASTDASGAVVWVRTVSPGASCATTASVTQPVDAALMPLVSGTVVFREQAKVASCP
ncbi:MAG TPA: protease complex subunit PrcB family protein [Gemmatirosa sp.]